MESRVFMAILLSCDAVLRTAITVAAGAYPAPKRT
jgi:hypothetical protein